MAAKVDLTEFFKYSRPKVKPCAVRAAREQLTDTEKQQLDAALSITDGTITTAAIRTWLFKRGHIVTDPAISVHRRGVCACARD